MGPTAEHFSVSIRLLVSACGIFGVFSGNNYCYMTGEGFDMLGHDMRVYNSTTPMGCKRLCQANCGCLAFVHYHNGTCLLKSMSLDAGIVSDPSAIIGFCTDPYDPERDHVYEHEWIGTNMKEQSNTTLTDCADICAGVDGASLYTWRADGKCFCKADFKRIAQHFGYTSGFLIARKKVYI
uniref:Apple domain-containing protein n=1 Tax=Plectus sambesii TaxID=2011161 RepID=A0A914W3J0_9BILA